MRTRFGPSVLIALCVVVCLAGARPAADNAPAATIDLPADVLRDKIRGGMLGQILGNLNGLPHEMKYIEQPGNVERYVPSLPNGAWTDDDTDFEWVYVVAMQRANAVLLSPAQVEELWVKRINKGIWCANRYARHLMDLGIDPPLTGRVVLNPWAEFNISGQFLCETFALMAPAMPQTASRIGLNYTQTAVDNEPLQTTQLFDTMIATAFVTNDMNQLLDAGVAALDPRSRVRAVAADVRRWHAEHPDDWRATRKLLQDKYTQANGGMRDKNGYELMTGSTVGALLYGKGDLAETLRAAFNFGWDADNSAATAGTIVGTVRGYKWILSRGYPVVDRYRNTTRDDMPADETITTYADRVIELAERVIADQGGGRVLVEGRPVWRIRPERPANVRPLSDAAEQTARLRTELQREIEAGLLQPPDDRARARAAYLAICLDLAPQYQREHAGEWRKAIDALAGHWKVVQNIYFAPETPAAEALKKKASDAGLKKPDKERQPW
jgi:hypothetical protein